MKHGDIACIYLASLICTFAGCFQLLLPKEPSKCSIRKVILNLAIIIIGMNGWELSDVVTEKAEKIEMVLTSSVRVNSYKPGKCKTSESTKNAEDLDFCLKS